MCEIVYNLIIYDIHINKNSGTLVMPEFSRRVGIFEVGYRSEGLL